MSENKGVQVRSNVKLTKQDLDGAASVSEMLNLPAIEERWVDTYQKTSGKTDGLMRFEAEKLLFGQAIASNSAFAKCDRFSVYAAFMEHALSGLTLRDGLAYLIPYGSKCQWMPGWKGRLEQILEMPDVVHVHEPQVVYDCDEFRYEKGMKTIIHSHVPKFPRPENAEISFVYVVVEFTYGPIVYMMDAVQVTNIRDKYSSSYKQYLVDVKNVQPNGKVVKSGRNGTYEVDFEPPMWVSDKEQAFKKTLVKRVYTNLPKLPKHKLLDDKMAEFAKANPSFTNTDIDEAANKSAEEIDALSAHLTDATTLDEDTGEITDAVIIDDNSETF